MASHEDIAKEFVKLYYTEFDKGGEARTQFVQSIYVPASVLTFESTKHTGKDEIALKLGNLGFQKVEHQISTLDVQTTIRGDILILVTGQLLVDEEQRPFHFTQVFYLVEEAGRWYPLSDIFKLVMGG